MTNSQCEELVKPSLESRVLAGQPYTDEEWNNYLLKIYKEQPACTPAVFANHKTSLGPSSYEVLAKQAAAFHKGGQTMVDLGTGSGYLLNYLTVDAHPNDKILGVDMSEDEIKIAKKEHGADPRLHFVTALAQQLPLAYESVDLIAAHMSIMLMRPIEPAIAELYRVLKKGGRLVAVTSTTAPATGTLKEINEAVAAFVKANYPKYVQPPQGDLRTRNLEGLNSLFLSQSFSAVETYKPFELNLEFTPEDAWTFFKSLVSVNILPASKQIELKEIVVRIAKSRLEANEKITLKLPLALWVVRK